jgi:hypothetical protein
MTSGIEWEMFSEEAERAVTIQMDMVAAAINGGHLKRTELPALVRAAMDTVTKAGYGEVHDTEPEWNIVTFVNEHCDTQGWVHISRDDLF